MTREQILALDGPEVDKAVALAMGMEFELMPAQIHVDWVDVVFVDGAAFIPHRDMNDVRTMWEFCRHEGNERFHEEYIGQSEYCFYDFIGKTPRQHCQAFLLAVLEVGA